MIQKVRPGGAKIEVWRRLGGVLGRLGSILGCLGELKAVLGASWECLGPSGRRLGVVLEASWGRHVGVLGPSWRYLVPDFQCKGG